MRFATIKQMTAPTLRANLRRQLNELIAATCPGSLLDEERVSRRLHAIAYWYDRDRLAVRREQDRQRRLRMLGKAKAGAL